LARSSSGARVTSLHPAFGPPPLRPPRRSLRRRRPSRGRPLPWQLPTLRPPPRLPALRPSASCAVRTSAATAPRRCPWRHALRENASRTARDVMQNDAPATSTSSKLPPHAGSRAVLPVLRRAPPRPRSPLPAVWLPHAHTLHTAAPPPPSPLLTVLYASSGIASSPCSSVVMFSAAAAAAAAGAVHGRCHSRCALSSARRAAWRAPAAAPHGALRGSAGVQLVPAARASAAAACGRTSCAPQQCGARLESSTLARRLRVRWAG
jgi:hypothetical protein